LGGRKGVRPVKNEWWSAGVVVCLERVADLHMAQLMPLPLTVFCFSKIHIGFIFLVLAHPGSPGKRAVNGCLCVCVIPVASENDSRVMVAWFVFSFRVVTYNILADIYADSDFSRDYLFCHCPADVLSMDYRKQLLLKELIGVYTIDLAS